MNGGDEFDKKTIPGSVKAAVNKYGDRISIGNLELRKKDQSSFPEMPSSKATEMKVKTKIRDMEKLKEMRRYSEELAMAAGEMDELKHEEVMKELELTKQELGKLKLDMASVLEQKTLAEKEMQVTDTKTWSNTTYAKSLTKRIQDANEERVLLELARIEAQIECEAIEANRKQQSAEYSSQIEQKKKKMKDLMEEIEHSKELETKLAETMIDIDILRNQVNGLRRISFPEVENLENVLLMQTVKHELELAKNELGFIKQEGFKLMTAMDIVREERRLVMKEASELRKSEKCARITIQNLDSDLEKAKSRLEVSVSAEENAREITSNLSQTLQKLKTDASVAKKETEIIRETIINVDKQNRKTKSEAELTEAKLHDAIRELEKAKSSESKALDRLKTLTSKTRTSRVSSSITLSKSEHLHLTESEVRSKQAADKKVEASRALIKALKMSENEISMKIRLHEREIEEVRIDEEIEVDKMEKILAAKRAVESEVRRWRRKSEMKSGSVKMVMQTATAGAGAGGGGDGGALGRKWKKENGKATPGRQARYRKTPSPMIGYMARSNSVKLRKRRKIMPDLSKFFSIKK